jgi:hypothetical protein
VFRVETSPGVGYLINLDLVAWASFSTVDGTLTVMVRPWAAPEIPLEGEQAQAFMEAFQGRNP